VSRYVVTGCAGFIGSHLAEALVRAGQEVVGVDSFEDYYPRPLKEANLAALRTESRFSLLELDLAVDPLDELLGGVAGVFHLAAQPGVRASWGATFPAYAKNNLLAAQRVFEEAAGTGARVVFASSSSVYGDAEAYPTREEARPQPISPYGVTKLGGEQLVHAHAASVGLEAVTLRYFTVYGPRQRPDMAFARIVAALTQGSRFTLYGTGEQSRDVTYVDDAVSATIAAMDRAPTGAVYNVGGGAEVSLKEAIGLLERLSGRTIEARYEPAAAGDARRTAADTTRIRSELGWSPRTAVEEGLAAQLSWAAATVGPR
jgi:nucleoside-diphosphate-sugar epimerase